MNRYWGAAIAALTLSGCGADIAGDTNFNTRTVLARTFANDANGLASDSAGSAFLTRQAVFVDFIGENTASVEINGNRFQVSRASDTTSRYQDADGQNLLFVTTKTNEGVATPDILYFNLVTDEGANGVDVLYFVDGNRTPVGQMPGTGVARYSGGVEFTEVSAAGLTFETGTIDLDVDFATGAVSGRLDDVMSGSSGAAMFIAPTNLSGTSFTSTLSGDITPLTGSRIDGQFFGQDADQVGGSFSASTASEIFTGYYGATK